MRFVETVARRYGPVRRPYVRLVLGPVEITAIVDTGADASSIDERSAQDLGLPYSPSGLSSGIGGDVATFRADRVTFGLFGPRSRRRRIEWVEVGKHTIELSVLRSPRRLPALLGRSDLLVHYRFALREADGEFELTPIARA